MAQFGNDWYNDLNNVDLPLTNRQRRKARSDSKDFDRQLKKESHDKEREQKKADKTAGKQLKAQVKKELIEQRDNAVRAESVARRKYLSLPDGSPEKGQALQEVNVAREQLQAINKQMSTLTFIDTSSPDAFEKSFNTRAGISDSKKSSQGQDASGKRSSQGQDAFGKRFLQAFYDELDQAASRLAEGSKGPSGVSTLFREQAKLYDKQAGGSKDPSGVSTQLREQAKLHDKQAGDEQKNAQANTQIANRDYRVEAEKNAVAGAATENAQKVANMGNASAGAAALERGVKSADYDTHMQRSDTQRAEGVKNQREMYGAQQTAAEERGNANVQDYKYRQMQQYNNESDDLSKDKGATENTEPQNTEPQNTEPQNTEPQNTEPQNTEPQQPEENDQPSNWQAVLNYLTYGNDPTSGWSTGQKPGYAEAKAFADKRGWQPIQASAEEYADTSAKGTGHLQQRVEQEVEGFSEAWRKGSGRFDPNGTGKQVNAGDTVNGQTVSADTFRNASTAQ